MAEGAEKSITLAVQARDDTRAGLDSAAGGLARFGLQGLGLRTIVRSVHTAIDLMTLGLKVSRGEWDALDDVMGQMPMGIGAVHKALRELQAEWTGAAAAAKQFADDLASGEKYQKAVANLKAYTLELRAQARVMGAAPEEKAIAQADEAYRKAHDKIIQDAIAGGLYSGKGMIDDPRVTQALEAAQAVWARTIYEGHKEAEEKQAQAAKETADKEKHLADERRHAAERAAEEMGRVNQGYYQAMRQAAEAGMTEGQRELAALDEKYRQEEVKFAGHGQVLLVLQEAYGKERAALVAKQEQARALAVAEIDDEIFAQTATREQLARRQFDRHIEELRRRFAGDTEALRKIDMLAPPGAPWRDTAGAPVVSGRFLTRGPGQDPVQQTNEHLKRIASVLERIDQRDAAQFVPGRQVLDVRVAGN